MPASHTAIWTTRRPTEPLAAICTSARRPTRPRPACSTTFWHTSESVITNRTAGLRVDAELTRQNLLGALLDPIDDIVHVAALGYRRDLQEDARFRRRTGARHGAVHLEQLFRVAGKTRCGTSTRAFRRTRAASGGTDLPGLRDRQQRRRARRGMPTGRAGHRPAPSRRRRAARAARAPART